MNRTAIILTVLAIVTLVGGYLWYTNSEVDHVDMAPPSNITDSVDTKTVNGEVPIVQTQSTEDKSEMEFWKLDIEYPSIVLATAPDDAQQANDVILGFVNRMKDGFLEDARDASKGKTEQIGTGSDLTVRYTMSFVSPTLLSIRFESSAYIMGVAHPDSESHVLNYDLSSHALLSTADLFISGNDYLGYLSSYTRSDLKQEFKELSDTDFTDFVVPGTEPKGENFREVAVTTGGLVVIFNPSQVAPYARGTVNVNIPLAEARQKLVSLITNALDQSLSATSTPVTKPEIILSD